jgi:hypothetical protein
MCLQAAFAKYDAYSNNTEEEFKNLAKKKQVWLIQVLMFTNEGDEIQHRHGNKPRQKK